MSTWFYSAFLSFSLRKRSSLTFDDNDPTRSTKAIGQKTCEWKGNPFCRGPECDLIDTIHLQRRPPRALTRDICNWCQGPINHPVSKRPCNAFYISTYVESKRVCHQCKPLSEKKGFLEAFPSVIWTICAIDLGGFTCHSGILPK